MRIRLYTDEFLALVPEIQTRTNLGIWPFSLMGCAETRMPGAKENSEHNMGALVVRTGQFGVYYTLVPEHPESESLKSLNPKAPKLPSNVRFHQYPN